MRRTPSRLDSDSRGAIGHRCGACSRRCGGADAGAGRATTPGRRGRWRVRTPPPSVKTPPSLNHGSKIRRRTNAARLPRETQGASGSATNSSSLRRVEVAALDDGRVKAGARRAAWSARAARSACRVRVARYTWRVSLLDDVVAETIADRIFASAAGRSDDADDAHPMPASQYFARKALNDVESEAALVEALHERCVGRVVVGADDLASVASLQRLAQTAWIHYCHAGSAAAGAEGDHFFGPLAKRAVRRAHHAALAIGRAAARAVTRAAIHAHQAARVRAGAPMRPRLARRPTGLSSRPRAPARRRVRAVAGAGSGSEEPGPEPSRSRSAVRLPPRRRS